MSLPENDPVLTRQILEFLTVGNEFCHFSEKATEYSKEDIVDYYRRILPLLYLKGSLVKTVTPSEPDGSERFVTEEEWELLYNTIRNKLYPDDHFWISSDPRDENSEVEKASLGECIADIYQDMKDFLALYQKNRHAAKENAVHDICVQFVQHWGPAATKALYAMHLLHMRTNQGG